MIKEKSLDDLRADIDSVIKGKDRTSSNYQKKKDDVLKQLISLKNCECVAKHLE